VREENVTVALLQSVPITDSFTGLAVGENDLIEVEPHTPERVINLMAAARRGEANVFRHVSAASRNQAPWYRAGSRWLRLNRPPLQL